MSPRVLHWLHVINHDKSLVENHEQPRVHHTLHGVRLLQHMLREIVHQRNKNRTAQVLATRHVDNRQSDLGQRYLRNAHTVEQGPSPLACTDNQRDKHFLSLHSTMVRHDLPRPTRDTKRGCKMRLRPHPPFKNTVHHFIDFPSTNQFNLRHPATSINKLSHRRSSW